MANLGPIRPGIHAGDRLEVHARVRAEYEAAGDADAIASLHVRWADQERSLSPGESWLRSEERRVGKEWRSGGSRRTEKRNRRDATSHRGRAGVACMRRR